jgi:lipoprotein-anchoring transpeptidase ErfK/SrfK
MYVVVRLFIGVVSIVLAALSTFGFPSFGASVIADKGTAAVTPTTREMAPQGSVLAVATPVPKVVSISPTDGEQEVLLDIEDPIIVRFDSSVKDFFVDFRLDPSVAVTYENNPEKTEFRLLPQESLPNATSHTLSVFIKRRDTDDSTYSMIASSQFTTPKEVLTQAQQSVAHKLAEAKRNTVAQITQGRYIDVTLASQVMVLFEDGKALDAHLISSGKRGLETPKGQFKIENKTKRAWSKSYGLYMPYWMALVPSGKFGIHELPEWPNGYKEGASHLGIPVSHGCVRLGVGPAQRTWDFADIGTPVIVH